MRSLNIALFLFWDAVCAINFDTTGAAIPITPSNPSTSLTAYNQFSVNWHTIDPNLDATIYTGAFMITVSGQANNCGGAVLKTWDIDGTNPSAVPDPTLPVYAVTSGRCFIKIADSGADQLNIINQTVTTTLPVTFKRYESTKANPGYSLYTNVSTVMFANLKIMDIAIIQLNLMVKDVIGQIQFYPLMRARSVALTPVNVISYLDPYDTQIHFMRASYSNHI